MPQTRAGLALNFAQLNGEYYNVSHPVAQPESFVSNGAHTHMHTLATGAYTHMQTLANDTYAIIAHKRTCTYATIAYSQNTFIIHMYSVVL